MVDAIIFAAGKGTRLRPITNTRPKPLVYVAGKPILWHTLSALDAVGVEKVVVIGGHMFDKLSAYVDRLKKEQVFSLDIVVVKQQDIDKKYGTAVALKQGVEHVGDEFFAIAGDVVFDPRFLRKILKTRKKKGWKRIVGVKAVMNAENYGSIVVENGQIKKIYEKVFNPPSNLVNMSIYYFTKDIGGALNNVKPSKRGEYEIIDVLDGAHVVECDGFWGDVAFPWDLLRANRLLLETMKPTVTKIENSTIRGNVIMEEGAKIFNSYIDVGIHYIGANTKIGPHAYLRGWNMIAEDCVVGDSVSVKNSILFPRVKAKHICYIGDSIIGSDVNFGGGTQIGNFRFDAKYVKMEINGKIFSSNRKKLGAVVGDRVKFGLLSGVMPGKKIGNDSWIGPGVIVMKDVPAEKKVFLKQQLTY